MRGSSARQRQDGLTGALDRSSLHTELREAVGAASLRGGVFALALLDLDHFREVNLRHGLRQGDLVLREFTRRLIQLLPEGAICGRIGDDEFAVVFPGVRSANELGEKIEASVFAALSLPLAEAGVEASASVGAALYPLHAEDPERLLGAADLALRRSKLQRGSWSLYSPVLNQQPNTRFTPRELRQAINNDELVVHYQPQVCLTEPRLLAVEALVRWQHPRHGLLLPGRFLAAAEQPALGEDLTNYVLGRALSDVARWQEEGLRVRMAQNLSPRVLGSQRLLRVVQEQLENSCVSPEQLEMEVTEEAVLGRGSAVSGTLRGLAELGIGLAVDDFGTGYSSLHRLREIPARTLKLDKALVEGVDTEEESCAIAQAAIQMGHSLGLTVIAEGIETASEMESLRKLGCDGGQGFHIARAMPSDELVEWARCSPWVSDAA